MTKHREEQLTRLLRRLRQRAFESDKAADLIDTVKKRLMPVWDRRHEEYMARRSAEFEFRTR